jgi:tetratricopeptide (TPR) repeat protein
VKEQQGAATDPRLAQDLLRVAQLVQQQKQQLAAAADPAACAAAKRLPVAVAPASSDSGSDGGSSSTASDSERTVTDEDGPQQQGRHRSGVKVSDLTWDPTQPYGADVDLNGVDPEALQALQMLRQQSQSGPSSSDEASDHGEGLQGLADLLGESAMIDDTWKDWDPTQDEDGRAATAVDTYSRLVSQSPLLQEFEQQQQQHVQSKTSRGKGRQQQSKQRVEESAAAGGDPQQMLKRIHKLIAAQQQQELAEQVQKSAEREKGNAAFKDGNWQGALKHYSAALEANPQDVRAFSNRAQLYLKMKRYAKSEEDCSKALQLLQGLSSAQQAAAQLDVDAVAAATLHSKVLYRRAVARKEQGMFKEALAVSLRRLADCQQHFVF